MKVKTKSLLMVLCVAMVVCFCSLLFVGCDFSDSNIKTLEEKIATLEQKVTELESSQTPEVPEVEEPADETIEINSKQDAYDVLLKSMERTLVNEDGSMRNIKIGYKSKDIEDLEWEIDEPSYIGTLSNGVTYMYTTMTWGDDYTDSLLYDNGTDVYSFYESFAEEDSPKYSTGKTKVGVESLKATMEMIPENAAVESYEKLSNGNYNVVVSSVRVHHKTTDYIEYYKELLTYTINENGFVVEVLQTSYRSYHDLLTGEKGVYTKEGDTITTLTFDVETPIRVYELISLAEKTSLSD